MVGGALYENEGIATNRHILARQLQIRSTIDLERERERRLNLICCSVTGNK